MTALDSLARLVDIGIGLLGIAVVTTMAELVPRLGHRMQCMELECSRTKIDVLLGLLHRLWLVLRKQGTHPANRNKLI